MPSPSSSVTAIGLEETSVINSSDVKKTASRNESRESLDLAMDIDLEKRLHPEAKDSISVPPRANVGPLTLAADDVESKLRTT